MVQFNPLLEAHKGVHTSSNDIRLNDVYPQLRMKRWIRVFANDISARKNDIRLNDVYPQLRMKRWIRVFANDISARKNARHFCKINIWEINENKRWNTERFKVFFQAAVVSILLYGCTTWTLTKRLEKKLDRNYTRMLRAVLNKSWRQHPTRHQLYGHLPLPSRKLYKLDEPDTRDTAGKAKTSS